jgi:LysR family transcriptional regulator, regulator for genes of the gallate degradation pathway
VLTFANRRPAHRVAFLEGAYEALASALRCGKADVLVGALRDGVASDLVQEPLFEDPLMLAVRAGHPLVRVRRLGRASLARCAWIAPRPESPLRRHFERLMQHLAGAAAQAIECNSLDVARALLLGSDRVMLLSPHQIADEVCAGQLVTLPHPLGRVVRTIGLTVRKGWQPTAAQAELLGAIRDAARALDRPARR